MVSPSQKNVQLLAGFAWVALTLGILSQPCQADPTETQRAASANTHLDLTQTVSPEERPVTETATHLETKPISTKHLPERSAEIPTVSVMMSPRQSEALRRRDQSSDRMSASEVTSWTTAMLPLAIVLGLIALAAWGAKRWIPSVKNHQSNVLEVVARTSVSPKHTVALVRLGRRYVMVGLGGDQVTTLCEITDPDEVSELLLRTGTSTTPKAGAFDASLVKECLEYDHQTDRTPEPSALGPKMSAPSPLKNLLNRLRNLQTE